MILFLLIVCVLNDADGGYRRQGNFGPTALEVPLSTTLHWAKMFSTTTTRRTTTKRITPSRVSLQGKCDYILRFCLNAYKTGTVCARNIQVHDRFGDSNAQFENYCQMDYVNCELGFEVFMVLHMGNCYVPWHHQKYVPNAQNAAPFKEDDGMLDQLYLN